MQILGCPQLPKLWSGRFDPVAKIGTEKLVSCDTKLSYIVVLH